MSSPQKKLAHSFSIHQDEEIPSTALPIVRRTASALPLPLTTSKMANQLPRESPKKTKTNEHDVLDVLMAKLNEQRLLNRQRAARTDDETSSSATDPFTNTPPGESSATSDSQPGAPEVDRLKKELEFATERMAQMDFELTQSRLARHTVEQAIGSPFPAAQEIAYNAFSGAQGPFNGAQAAFNAPAPRRPSPFDIGGAPQPLSMSAMPNGNAMPPAAFYRGNSDMQAAFDRPPSGFGSRPARHLGYTPPITPFPQNYPPPHLNNGQMNGLQAPIGTRLSPTATDFNSSWNTFAPAPAPAPVPAPQSYMNTTEPLNYRRLLDRNATTNWRYVVEKIVCNNDQQASIFLQQKLKVGTQDQKFEIVQAIIDQAYPLMINRFGNFLVQRCFEHSTPEQVVLIAQAIRGNTLNLSMDAFGCHVVQKAFDSVPEEYKAIMVHELLRRIPETVIHRYACHVWQKLFELRWSGSPPQIMKYVNEALRGMWHEVALGETGSLVVQNIFENCLEDDKRPCVNEVLASIDVIAHGQFGNWCIQHVCEHGAVPDRTRAVDHVLRFATEYSMDQFASKVVEKCLKIGGPDFLDRYLDRVCEARSDRPRMPLVDIAGDQFGNYLIQYILTNADPQRREIVAAHVRKHMVSLRGSKYGSRVAMLCCNPAFTTRPGPPVGLSRTNNTRYTEQAGFDMGGRPYHQDRNFMPMGRNSGYR